ncbi:MAG TPA: aminotransferase class I/II-fold pyridoxal phosphate-dependent enzyme [Bacteroidales bacterium]|nr:aminotransferase class I/II-fold pyridoxal phosphate-dependent enzyme [Bacteroidales bacterium]
MTKSGKKGFATKLIHEGTLDKDAYRSATVPIYQTSTFSFESAEDGARCFSGENNGYIYTRIKNPTIDALERQLAALENGYGGIAVSSGMAAATTIYLALMSQGDHIVSTDAIYGPARNVMEKQFVRFGFESTYIRTTGIETIRKAIRPNTRILYLETPANPTMDISDIAACAELAHRNGILLVVDNTFCSPYLQNPLDLGADIVFHSMTKFINGHADVVAGMIVTKEKVLYETLRNMMVNLGCNMDPHQAYLVLRGIKTLGIRIDRAQENARKVAAFLESHPKVAWVSYPGLPSHPQYELALKQMRGSGSMISFGLKGGYESARMLLDNLRVALLAVSLGGVETLIQHPASMTHSKVSAGDKQKAGITDDLIRLAVGIEDAEDIIEDLDQGLKKTDPIRSSRESGASVLN